MSGKTILVTGASQGIGLALALKFAKYKSNIVILTKDSQENIDNAANQVIAAGGKVLALHVDISSDREIKEAVSKAVSQFESIDILINNTSATCFTNTLSTLPEQFDLVISTSVRAAFLLSQACFPYLQKSENPHIINISPPLSDMSAHWFKDHLAFSIAKYSMSMCTLGMSSEFKDSGIAINSLWPQTTIATQTIKDHLVPKVYSGSRWPSIMADAAYEIALGTFQDWTGQFFTDEELLRKSGVTDFTHYAVDANVPLTQPLFIPLEDGMAPISKELFLATTLKKEG